MSRKRREQPIIENVTITGVAAEGKSLVRINELVVFVPFVVPGDVVDLKILRKKHSYAEAVAVKFHKLSDVRAVPFCRHFGICGGCKWQNLPYQEQLRFKQQQVVDNLTRIAKVELPEISPILGSEETVRYRNKLEYSFSNMRWLTEEELTELDNPESNAQRKQPGLGFHIPGAFDKVLHINECWLQDEISDRIRNSAYDYAVQHGIPFINLRSQEGILRDMMVRVVTTGQIMVLVQAKVTNPSEQEQFMGLMRNLRFKIGPKSFFQTNSRQAYRLYSVVRDLADLKPDETVYDLYTGTGTIAQFIAAGAGKVVGIEYVPEAIEDAKVNAALNNIDNTEFYAGDMKDVLNADFISVHGVPDVIITDPPRAGMHPDVVNVILTVAPRRIVYVSCNPATQARDIALLDQGYRVAGSLPSRPLIQFPAIPIVIPQRQVI